MIHFIIPVRDEEKNIARTLDGIFDACAQMGEPCRVVVVNDGSVDGTAAEIARHGRRDLVETIDFGGNKGIGQVILKGFSRACETAEDGDQLVFMEGDGSNDPAELAAMTGIFRGGADVVAASRYMAGGRIVGFPAARRISSLCANRFLQIMFPIPCVSDYTYFFKMYRAGIVKRALEVYGDGLVQCPGFAANSEFFIKMRRFTSGYAQAPALYDYSRKKSGSKFSIAREAMELFSLVKICRRELKKR